MLTLIDSQIQFNMGQGRGKVQTKIAFAISKGKNAHIFCYTLDSLKDYETFFGGTPVESVIVDDIERIWNGYTPAGTQIAGFIHTQAISQLNQLV